MGMPVLRVSVCDVKFPTLAICDLLQKKSRIKVHNELPPRLKLLSFCTSLWGMIVLKAELKSTNTI